MVKADLHDLATQTATQTDWRFEDRSIILPNVLMKPLKLCITAAFLTVVLCNGCAAHDLPVPITTIGTLQPTLAWTPPTKSRVTYDLIICLGVDKGHGLWIPGKTVYYRQGIQTTTHTVGQPLSPGTVYVWSVRTRSEKGTSDWAARSDGLRYNVISRFKTPGN
jgi:hypothetical protein